MAALAVAALSPRGLTLEAGGTARVCRGVRWSYEARTFFGYDCAGGCVDHKAGFAAAERWAITQAGACNFLPQKLIEGCRAHADEGLSAYEAGYAWAAENEIDDPCLCPGAGAAFEAGCREYLPLPATRLPYTLPPAGKPDETVERTMIGYLSLGTNVG